MFSYKRKKKARANGTGTAYRRGKTWTGRVVLGWHDHEGHKVPDWATKGGFQMKKEALAWCAATLDKGKTKPADNTSFLALYDAWEENYSPRIGRSTLDCYKAAKRHFAPIHGKIFRAIDIDELQDCLDSCGAGKRTLENMKALAGLLYKYAIPRHMAELNLAQYLDTGTGKKGTRPPFTPEQIDLVTRSVGKILYADYILALIYTGFRPSELLSLSKVSYDTNTGILTGGGKTEAGTNRIVPVAPTIRAIIESRLAAEPEYLFPGPDGKAMTEGYFRTECFYPALEAMGIGGLGLSPYSCRHSFANFLKAASGSDTDKAALMGHASPTMTKYYQSPDLESLKRIINTITNTIGQISE